MQRSVQRSVERGVQRMQLGASGVMTYHGIHKTSVTCTGGALPQRTWALWGPQGPHEGGGRPPWALWGPQGPQEGTGSLPGGSPGQGEHGEEVRSHFWKTRFLAPRPSPVQPVKTASKQAPQPPGPISIAPGCFSGPGGYQKCLRSLPGDPFWVPGAARGGARAARGSARAARGVPELPFLKKSFFFRCRYSLRGFFSPKNVFS